MFAPKALQKTPLATPRGRLQVVKQTYADGSTYEGGYLNFKKQGQGVISFSNGETYNGHWAEGLKNGSGVYTWADGSQYIGEWHADKMSGQGVHVSSNGSKYSGSWNDNLMHGSGSYAYDNGSVYIGEWFQGYVSTIQSFIFIILRCTFLILILYFLQAATRSRLSHCFCKREK